MWRFLQWAGLASHDGRRAWAFLALLGASAVMTAFAAVVLYIVRGDMKLAFWLGVAAHVQILMCLSGFMAMFIKRDIAVGKDGLSIKDTSNADADPDK